MEMNKTVLYNAIGLGVFAAAAIAFVLYERNANPSVDSGDPAAAQAAPPGLNKPRGLAVDEKGNILVANSRNHRIEWRDLADKELKKFGSEGTREGQFREPCDVAVDSEGNIYVADTFYTTDPGGGLPWGRIQKFDSDGDFEASWGKLPEGAADLFGPRSIAVNSKDEVFLSDTGNHRVVKYSAKGRHLATLGKQGSKPGEFSEPFGLAFDAQDNLYVADRLNFRVQVFGPDLKFKRQFKIDGWDAQQINMEPYLAVDNKGKRLFVSDPLKNKVYAYSLDGKKLKEYTTSAKGPLNLPTGLAWHAASGTLVVSDAGNRLVTLKP